MRLSHTIHFTIVPGLALVGCALALVGCANVMDGNGLVRSRKAPEQVKSFILDGGVDLTVVFIDGGSFLMGTPRGERGRDEVFGLAAHNVQVRDFWIGRFEVTEAQYGAIMEEDTSNGRSQLPLTLVRWIDAVEFCRRVSERTGWEFNLPTEAQWEYACRAGSKTRFSFGDSKRKLGDYAWYEGNNSKWSELGYRHEVGKKRPNDWGLYDMHGNVWEWCLDRFEHRIFEEPAKNPEDKELFEKRVFIPRVIKGGCWWNLADDCRSASRHFYYEDIATIKVGFRVVAMPPDDEVPPTGAETDP